MMQFTSACDLDDDPPPKEMALDYLTTYRPERSAFVVRHALEAAKAVDFPIQTFGGTRNFLPQALAVWEGRAQADEAKREADVRIDEQLRREHEDRERRRRLADIRAALSDAALATLRYRAEEALANDGAARTRLGSDMLVKLTRDEFLLEARHDGRGALNQQAGESLHVEREAAHHGGVDQSPDA